MLRLSQEKFKPAIFVLAIMAIRSWTTPFAAHADAQTYQVRAHFLYLDVDATLTQITEMDKQHLSVTLLSESDTEVQKKPSTPAFAENISFESHNMKFMWTNGESLQVAEGVELEDYGVEMHAAPLIISIEGQPAEIRWGSEPPQYFERDADGLFDLKTLEQFIGISLSTTIQSSSMKGMIDYDIAYSVSSTSDRQKLTNVDLDIGKPIVTTDKSIFQGTISPGTWLVTVSDAPGKRGALLVLIRITKHKEK